MLNINETQKVLLCKHISEGQKYIDNDDIGQLLDDLDAKITEIGFDENYDLNEEGLKLQRLYDALYDQN